MTVVQYIYNSLHIIKSAQIMPLPMDSSQLPHYPFRSLVMV